MRGTIQQILTGGVGFAPWIPQDYYQTPPAITLAGYVSNGANLTWEVQLTSDGVTSADARGQDKGLVSVTQAGNTITVIDDGGPNSGGGHGLSVGDSVQILGSGNNGYDGNYNVATVPSLTSYTVQSTINQNFVHPDPKVITARVFVHGVLNNQNGRAISNYAFPVRGSRLVLTAWASGVAYLTVLQGAIT